MAQNGAFAEEISPLGSVNNKKVTKVKQSSDQVDSSELLEMLETTKMTENFTKVTKYLTTFKETLINYVLEKAHVKKT